MSVHKRKDGYWFVKYKQNDKWIRKYFGKDGESQAREFEIEIKQLLAKSENQIPTLAELADQYFVSMSGRLHPQTQSDIVRYLTDACASFLEKPCDKLSRRDLEAMRLKMKGNKASTINRAHAYITAILNWGLEQELIHRNPWQGASKLKEETFVVSATVEDFRAIMKCAAPHLKWAMDVSLNLALRPGKVELLRLKWDGFKWSSGYVEIVQGKNAGLKRVVPPKAFMERARLRYEQDKVANIPWVVHYNGRQIDSLKTAWRSAKEKAGYKNKPIRLYDLRHVAATEMLAAGADPVAVQYQLGHRKLSTTLDNYSHIVSGAQERAARMLPDLNSDEKDEGG